MSKFFDDTMRSLLEAVQIEKSGIPLTEYEGMPGKTLYVKDDSENLIDKIVEIRKSSNISQEELAKMTGNSQQTISRFERKTHSPSLNTYMKVANALGYELELVKK